MSSRLVLIFLILTAVGCASGPAVRGCPIPKPGALQAGADEFAPATAPPGASLHVTGSGCVAIRSGGNMGRIYQVDKSGEAFIPIAHAGEFRVLAFWDSEPPKASTVFLYDSRESLDRKLPGTLQVSGTCNTLRSIICNPYDKAHPDTPFTNMFRYDCAASDSN